MKCPDRKTLKIIWRTAHRVMGPWEEAWDGDILSLKRRAICGGARAWVRPAYTWDTTGNATATGFRIHAICVPEDDSRWGRRQPKLGSRKNFDLSEDAASINEGRVRLDAYLETLGFFLVDGPFTMEAETLGVFLVDGPFAIEADKALLENELEQAAKDAS